MERKEVDGWNHTVNVRRPNDTASRYELFRYWLITNAELYEVTKDEDVMAHLRGLERSLSDRIKDEESGGIRRRRKKKRKLDMYFAVFRRKYVEQFDLQYNSKLTSGERKGIPEVIATLEKNHLSYEEYLSWFFDEIMERPESVRAPKVKTTFSTSFLDTFIVRNKELIKQRRKEAVETTKERDIFHRLRALVRGGYKNLASAMREYRNGDMTLLDLQKLVEKYEGD